MGELLDLRDAMGVPYLFGQAGGPHSIGHHVVGHEMARANEVVPVLIQAGLAQERYQQLYFRVLGALTMAAEEFESSSGLALAPEQMSIEEGRGAPDVVVT